MFSLVAHEAWHVVQQKQGRVKPTVQTNDVVMNDDHELEHEAELRGKQAEQLGTNNLYKNPASAADSIRSNPSLAPIQAKPEDWVKDENVNKILSYKGSAEYWRPVKVCVAEYVSLNCKQVGNREEALKRLREAIANWRENQHKSFLKSTLNIRSELDKLKAEALQLLAGMIERELAEIEMEKMGALVPRTTTTSGPIMIGPVSSTGRETKTTAEGSASFTEGLSTTPKTEALGLTPVVMPTDVRKLEDPKKCLVSVGSDRTLRTHDGRFPIDTGGATARYVIVVEGSEAVLYASQEIAEEDAKKAEGPGIREYPILASHAQIGGTVIGAGDMIVEKGRIRSITNQSGTWQPRGSNLAKTLKLLVRLGVLDEDEIVSGEVTVQQWIKTPDILNVDLGKLVALPGETMKGKLS